MPATSLIGREALAADVIQAVDAGRLVTLVGPGGVGKTRLLTEVGHRLLAARPDRPVVMCELATSGSGSAVDVVAAALGIDARPGVSLVDRVVDVLGEAEIVLLVDNCEHVLDPTARARGAAARPRARTSGWWPPAVSGSGSAGSTSGPCPRCPPATRTHPRCCCSWSGHGRSCPASIPTRRSSPASPRSCGGWTACPWPSSWPPPASTPTSSGRWPRASTSASRCCRRASAARTGTGRSAPPCRGRTGCSTRTSSRRSRICRCSRVRSTPPRPPRSAEAMPASRPRRWPAWWSVHWSCGRRTRRYVLLETLRAFGAEELDACRPGRCRGRAPCRDIRSSGWRRPTGGCSSPACPCWRSSTPRSRSCAARSPGCSTTETSSSPVVWSVACCTTGSSVCVPTSSRGPSGSPSTTRTTAAPWLRMSG